MRYRSFLIQFALAFGLFVGLHALIRLGYPLLKGASFDQIKATYRFPFLAIPIAVGIAIVRSKIF